MLSRRTYVLLILFLFTAAIYHVYGVAYGYAAFWGGFLAHSFQRDFDDRSTSDAARSRGSEDSASQRSTTED